MGNDCCGQRLERARIRGRGGLRRLLAESSTYARYKVGFRFAPPILLAVSQPP